MHKRTNDVQCEFREEIPDLDHNSIHMTDLTVYRNGSVLFDLGGAGYKLYDYNCRLHQLEAQHRKNNRNRSDWARLPNTILALCDAAVSRSMCS